MRPIPSAILAAFLATTTSAAWSSLFGSPDQIEVTPDGDSLPLSDVKISSPPSKTKPGPPTNPNAHMHVKFINNAHTNADLYWDDGSYGVAVGTNVPARGGTIEMDTYDGHKVR